MTARKRLLSALRGEKWGDRIPWAPLIDGYFLSSFPPGTDVLDAFSEIGADALVRHVYTWSSEIVFRRDELIDEDLRKRGNSSFETLNVKVSLTREIKEEGTVIRRSYLIEGYELSERFVYTATSPYIPFPIEYLIKNADDMGVYKCLIQKDKFNAIYDSFLAEDARIGNAGVATDSGKTSPIQELLQHQIGVEAFYTKFLPEYPDETDSLIRLMHERNMRAYEIMAGSPAEVVIDYENTSSTLISPELYERYCLPFIDDYADILHRKGKIFLTHRCGKLKNFLPLLQRGTDDGIADISPHPTGDVSLWEAKQMLPDKIVIGGIDATAFASWPVKRIETYSKEVIEKCKDFTGVILGSADAVPQNARVENLRAITGVIDKLEAGKRVGGAL